MGTTFTKKQVLCIAIAATIVSMSGAASAQSPEYRQGYDQGYRDGMEAQGHADHGGPMGRIIIEDANYGARDAGVCHPRESIQRMIGWRRHADVVANNELCGDPAPGVRKHLEIRYRCGDSQPLRAEAPENSVISLSCE